MRALQNEDTAAGQPWTGQVVSMLETDALDLILSNKLSR
jgi:hypothetical protein